MSEYKCLHDGCDKESYKDWPYCEECEEKHAGEWGVCVTPECWDRERRRWCAITDRGFARCAKHGGADYLHGSHEEHAAAQSAKSVLLCKPGPSLVARVNLHQGQAVTADAVEGVLLRGPWPDRAPSDPLSDLTEAAEEAGEALALAQEEHALVALLVHARAAVTQGRWAQALADLYRVRGDAVRCQRLALWCAVRDFARAAETKAEGGEK